MKTYSHRPFIAALSSMIFLAGFGCAPKASSPSPLANKALVKDTEIYMGSDQYGIEVLEPSSNPDADSFQAPVENAQQVESAPPTDDRGEAGVTKSEKTEPRSKRKAKSDASSGERADVEYVLKKSKTIQVGVASSAAPSQSQNVEKSFTPASITKVLTTAIALKELGADFRFRTRVGFRMNSAGQASNVVIAADGDPTAGVTAFEAGAPNRMREIAEAFRSRGVREVTGAITFVSSDPRLDEASFASGVPLSDVRECYGALAGAFNYRENCAPVKIDPRAGFAWETAEVGAALEGQVDAVAGSNSKLSLAALLGPDRSLKGYRLSGVYNSAKPKTVQARLPVANGAGWYASGVLQALRDAQIGVVNASLAMAKTPQERAVAMSVIAEGGEKTFALESAPLQKIIVATNKPSDNFFADALFKAVGSRLGPKRNDIETASRSKAKENLETWLRDDGHAAWSGELHFLEGAGLSSENRATPRAFLAALRRIAAEPTFPQLLESLPVAGVDGTLAERMKNTIAAGKVRAKTGTLKGSYQLVGFLPRQRGSKTEYVPFVILTSTSESNRGLVRQFQDALVVKMMEALKTE